MTATDTLPCMGCGDPTAFPTQCEHDYEVCETCDITDYCRGCRREQAADRSADLALTAHFEGRP